MLSIDFETRSSVNLPASGAHPYSEHPSTKILCLGYAFDNEPVECIHPPFDLKKAYRIIEYVQAGKSVNAWNAQFEYLIWNNVLAQKYPPFNNTHVPLKQKQLYDTMAASLVAGYPASLKEAAKTLDTEFDKLDVGRLLINKLNKGLTLTPTELDELYQYCMNDVLVERELYLRLPPLNTTERAIYLLTNTINNRGVKLDKSLIEVCRNQLEQYLIKSNRELHNITKGQVTKSTQGARILRWLHTKGIDLPDLRANTVQQELLTVEHKDAKRVLQIRADTARSSTAKLNKMLQVIGPYDKPARGMFQYYGASTGRWAGRLIQPQNLPRPTIKPEKALIHVAQGEKVPESVSSLLRYMFIARPGNIFYAGDYSQIEARVLAWIAGQKDLVKEFAKGSKIYEGMASVIFNTPVEDVTQDQRFIGKSVILGAGYQMGAPRFKSQIMQMTGIHLDLALAKQAIRSYRTRYKNITNLWRQLNYYSVIAMRKPDSTIIANDYVKFHFDKASQTLHMGLPSGRWIAYNEAELYTAIKPYKRTAIRYKSLGLTRKWQSVTTYGGKLTENAVQAIARDVLAESMLRLELKGYKIVLTIHDEIVSECSATDLYSSLPHFLKVMSQPPIWASGLPLAVEGWEGERYRK